MAAALELAAEGADELAVRVEHENRRMVGLVEAPFVDDVDRAVAADGDVVGRLPGELLGELRPVVVDFVLMVADADDRSLRVGLRRGEDGGSGERGERAGRGLLDERATIERMAGARHGDRS